MLFLYRDHGCNENTCPQKDEQNGSKKGPIETKKERGTKKGQEQPDEKRIAGERSQLVARVSVGTKCPIQRAEGRDQDEQSPPIRKGKVEYPCVTHEKYAAQNDEDHSCYPCAATHFAALLATLASGFLPVKRFIVLKLFVHFFFFLLNDGLFPSCLLFQNSPGAGGVLIIQMNRRLECPMC